MRQRLRSAVWRELPYSARKALTNSARRLRAIEEWCDRVWVSAWASLHESPAWLFVAVAGSSGIALTVLLFFALTQELLADRTTRHAPIVDRLDLDVSDPHQIDARLCLDDAGSKQKLYPAEFEFDGTMLASIPRRPTKSPEPVEIPVRTVRNVPPDDVPAIRPAMREEPVAGNPNLMVEVDLWHQRQPPSTARELTLTAKSDAADVPASAARRNLDAGWSWFRERTGPTATVEPYTGVDTAISPSDEDTALDDFTAWPSRTDIAFQVELHAPAHATLNSPGKSHLVVRNTGSEPIRRLEISEPIAPLNIVTHASPPAKLVDGVLLRELKRVRAGRDRELALEWTPQAAGDRHYEARVMAEALIAAVVQVDAEGSAPPTPPDDPVLERNPRPTPVAIDEPMPVPEPTPEPAPPSVDEIATPPTPEPEEVPRPIRRPPRRDPLPIEEPVPVQEPPVMERREPPVTDRRERPAAVVCQVTPVSQVTVGDVAEVEIRVANAGDADLHNVRVWVDVPPSLKHHGGTQLECRMGDLAGGETRGTTLKVVAAEVGWSHPSIRVVTEESVDAAAKAAIPVVPAAAAPVVKPRRLPAPCACDRQLSWYYGSP